MKQATFDTVIYSLNIEDAQTVAREEIGRELSENEIEKIVELLGGNIGWYDAIAGAINKTVQLENTF